jgi:uncharacterized protein (TIGR02246 family)
MNTMRAKQLAAVVAIVAVIVGLATVSSAAHPDSAAANDAAIKQVVAGISGGWNNHDAKAMCAPLAEDVQWVNWRGEVLHSRKEVEDQHATLFAGIYKNTHRTDEVRTIRYLTPELAAVDDYWTMTGAKTREGTDWPYRAGYVDYLMAKRGGSWVVIVSHTADFNAKAAETSQR